MRKWREQAAIAALLLAAWWLSLGEPRPQPALLRAEPPLKQLPRNRSGRTAVPAAQLPARAPALPETAEPEAVWLRVESSGGEPLAQASVTLRKVGDALHEPVDLDSTTTSADGLAAIAIEPFANLTPEAEAEVLIEVSEHTSKLVSEAELMTALGRSEPYLVVLDDTQTVTLTARCPWVSDASIYLGWYTDDGIELQRFGSTCAQGEFVLEDVVLPLVPLHLVAFIADPEAPSLGLRSYRAVTSTAPTRLEIPLSRYAIEFRSVRLVDTRGAGVSDTLIEPALLTSPGALLDRWLNYDVLTTDLAGRFDWISARGRSSQVSVTPPGFAERRTLELRAGRDQLLLEGVSMVRCHFLGAGGEALYFSGYQVSAESISGELSGWITSAGDASYSGQANFAWPEGARSLTVDAQGFTSATLGSAHAPCVLTATAEYRGRRPRILR
ncbi:MAG TPA: hypothetical protein VFZ61_02190 [Polyangiales bacterium]